MPASLATRGDKPYASRPVTVLGVITVSSEAVVKTRNRGNDMQMIALLGALLSAGLTPVKTWVAPDAPLTVSVKAEGDERLVLSKFGSDTELGSKDVAGESTPDLKQIFPQVKDPGCYVLYLVPKDKKLNEFTGTPLVLGVRRRQAAQRRHRTACHQGRTASLCRNDH